MQFKTTIKYYFIPVRAAIYQKKKDKLNENVKKRKPFFTVGRNINWHSYSAKQYGVLKKIKNETAVWSSNNPSQFQGGKVISLQEIPALPCSMKYYLK